MSRTVWGVNPYMHTKAIKTRWAGKFTASFPLMCPAVTPTCPIRSGGYITIYRADILRLRQWILQYTCLPHPIVIGVDGLFCRWTESQRWSWLCWQRRQWYYRMFEKRSQSFRANDVRNDEGVFDSGLNEECLVDSSKDWYIYVRRRELTVP